MSMWWWLWTWLWSATCSSWVLWPWARFWVRCSVAPGRRGGMRTRMGWPSCPWCSWWSRLFCRGSQGVGIRRDSHGNIWDRLRRRIFSCGLLFSLLLRIRHYPDLLIKELFFVFKNFHSDCQFFSLRSHLFFLDQYFQPSIFCQCYIFVTHLIFSTI